MKKPRPPHRIGRKRRAAGWTLLTLGVAVAGVWVWSGWGRLLWEFAAAPGPHATLDRRQLRVVIRQTGFEDRHHGDFRNSEVRAGLWPIPLLLSTSAALLLRSGVLARRRAMTNTCTGCGYSLTGIATDALCPECGRQPTPRLDPRP